MASMAESIDSLVYVGFGIFLLIIVLSLSYQSSQTAVQNLQLSSGQSLQFGGNSANAVNDVVTNTLSITLTGATGWITTGHPLTISITGNQLNAGATNALFATFSAAQTQTFTITSPTSPQTLTTTTGNFYNITAVTLTGIGGEAFPSIGVTVTQTFNSAVHGSAPAAFVVNTITASSTYLYTTNNGVIANETTYTGQLPNTFGGALQLAVFALVFIAVLLAVLGALRPGGVGPSGGFLG